MSSSEENISLKKIKKKILHEDRLIYSWPFGWPRLWAKLLIDWPNSMMTETSAIIVSHLWEAVASSIIWLAKVIRKMGATDADPSADLLHVNCNHICSYDLLQKNGIVNMVLSILLSPVIALAFSEFCRTVSSRTKPCIAPV